MNNNDIITHINSGAADADLERLFAAITSRRSVKADVMFFSLRPGQHVWFTDRCRPAYMKGREAVIQAVNRSRVELRMLKPRPHERFQGDFTCSPELFVAIKPLYAVE